MNFKKKMILKEEEGLDGFDFTAAGNLWSAVVMQAKSDLKGNDDRNIIENQRNFEDACLYFFTFSIGEELRDIRTFDGLCRTLNIDPDFAARRIFFSLHPTRRRRVCQVLQDRGYSVIVRQSLFRDSARMQTPSPLPQSVAV